MKRGILGKVLMTAALVAGAAVAADGKAAAAAKVWQTVYATRF